MTQVIRLQHIYNPLEHNLNNYTHAANPCAFPLSNSIVRIFFNSRNTENQSCVFSVDLEINHRDFKFVTTPQLLIGPGSVGLFDDSGVSIGNICKTDNNYHFYYMGWNIGKTVPWRNAIGVAEYDLKLNSIIKFKKSPVLDRSEEDPYTLSYPWVLKHKSKFYMFYGSNQTWDTTKVDIDHILKIAVSDDSINWKTQGPIKLNTKNEANAFCRPSIIFLNNKFLMAYAFRKDKYQIGFLESTDLYNWQEIGLFSPDKKNPWESEEVTYPSLFILNEKIYMLYCGNKYGQTGFGIAELSFN